MKGKRIAITGVSSGIGAATARHLASRGAHVIGFDRHEPTLPLEAFHRVDLVDPASIEESLAALERPLDGLCNIAGVPPTADKHSVLRINFFGLRHFTEKIVDHLSDGSPVVSLASLAGFGWRGNIDQVEQGLATSFADADRWIDGLGVEGAPSYHLSKELVIVWSMWTCQRWKARGIRLNTVSPGPVATPILQDFIETLGKRAEEDLKQNRAATADEIAAVVAFMCTRDAAWMNGADVAVDGGASAAAWRQSFRH